HRRRSSAHRPGVPRDGHRRLRHGCPSGFLPTGAPGLAAVLLLLQSQQRHGTDGRRWGQGIDPVGGTERVHDGHERRCRRTPALLEVDHGPARHAGHLGQGHLVNVALKAQAPDGFTQLLLQLVLARASDGGLWGRHVQILALCGVITRLCASLCTFRGAYASLPKCATIHIARVQRPNARISAPRLARSASVTASNRCSSNASASAKALPSAALTACSTRQSGASERWPSANSAGSPSASCNCRKLTFDRSAVIRQPPPWPRTDDTSPASRSRPIVRRTTTGLVRMHSASVSEVTGSSAPAMCSRACRTADRRLSRFM